MLFGAVLLSLAACNNSEQSKDKETTTTPDSSPTTNNAESAPPPSAPVSTISTTPTSMLVIRHKVANYEKWKMAYDGHDSARLANGLHSYVIGRGVQDPGVVLVAMKVDDTAKAMAFVKDPSMKPVMQKAGVIGAPNVSLITMTYQDTATISSPLRSVVAFTVKDLNTWKTNFDAANQSRTDNGLTVRAYGHEANDMNKVRVVTGLIDSAKAVAYFKSDTLKKRMEASGVIGKPDRFLYRVVQRY